MGGRLTLLQKKAIERFIGTGPKEFKLLYSFTQHGASATTFHHMCDNKGPTVVVIHNKKGCVYGGYVEKSWISSSTEIHFKDDKAFLFRLMYNGKAALNKFPVKNPDEAFYCNATDGPVFGSGYDLNVFSGSLSANEGVFTLNGKTNFGTSYDMGGISAEHITFNINTVYDVEVYGVSESSPVDDDWRDHPGWNQEDFEDLKRFIYSFAPPHGLGIDKTNILVIGPVGAGKSSFFNTVASVFRRNISNQAVCGSAEKSITTTYRMYRVRCPDTKPPMNFCLCDTMGLEENQGIDAQELTYILDGHVPDGYQFNPTRQFSSDTHGFITSPTLGNKIHCVCFIFDGSTATILSDKMLDKIKSLQEKVRQKGLPQSIVLTKIDNACSLVEEDVKNVFRSATIEELVNQASNIFGVPRSFILPLKNYEKETDVKTDVSILAMYTLKRLLLSTENYLLNILDQRDKDNQASGSLE